MSAATLVLQDELLTGAAVSIIDSLLAILLSRFPIIKFWLSFCSLI